MLLLYIGEAGYSLTDARSEPTGSFFSSSVKKKDKKAMESLLVAEKPLQKLDSTDVVLVAVAHPDDETVMHAEYIRRAREAGSSVHIAYATVGEESTINARLWQPGFVRSGRRWAEAVKAARRLGIPQENLHRLEIPDGQASGSMDLLTERLGNIILSNNVSRVVTSGPDGYDSHSDHIAVDAAALKATEIARQKHGKDIKILRLDKEGHGQLSLKVDTDYKLYATLAHYSQFPGISLFGRLILARKTKSYLANYHQLVYQKETYNLE
jgi:LmbE family N-acetylglucosaminyl deacetylase